MIGTKAGFEDHLSRFTNCAFAGLARAKLAGLTPQAEAVVRMPPANAVDPAGVGIWETKVPNNRGIARWIWDIRPGGTYRFRSEGPGALNSHEGTITLSDATGRCAPPSAWRVGRDGGPYEFRDTNTLMMAGRLGTGIWRRVEAVGP